MLSLIWYACEPGDTCEYCTPNIYYSNFGNVHVILIWIQSSLTTFTNSFICMQVLVICIEYRLHTEDTQWWRRIALRPCSWILFTNNKRMQDRLSNGQCIASLQSNTKPKPITIESWLENFLLSLHESILLLVCTTVHCLNKYILYNVICCSGFSDYYWWMKMRRCNG